MITMTKADWLAEGLRRFGTDFAAWRFVCPSCGHVAAVADWKAAGAPENAVAFSCVGRFQPGAKEMCESPGPCNYAGGGLFRLNPVRVTDEDGKPHEVFAFADPVAA